jgi:hypothetical protein
MIEYYNARVSALIQKSSLSDEDKIFWENALNGLPENFCFYFYDFLQDFPHEINKLTDSLRGKYQALKAKDINALEKFIDKDKQYIKSLGQ